MAGEFDIKGDGGWILDDYGKWKIDNCCCPAEDPCDTKCLEATACGCCSVDEYELTMSGFDGGCAVANGTHTLVRTPADDDNTYTATAGHLTITLQLSSNCSGWIITVSGGCLDTGPSTTNFTRSCCIEGVTTSGITIDMVPKVAGNFLNQIEVTLADVVGCPDCTETLCSGAFGGSRLKNITFTGLNGTHTLTYDADLSGPSWPALGVCVWSADVGNVSYDAYTYEDCGGDPVSVSSTILLTARVTSGNVMFNAEETGGRQSFIFSGSQAKVAGEGHCSDTLETIGLLANAVTCCRDIVYPGIGTGGTADITWSP